MLDWKKYKLESRLLPLHPGPSPTAGHPGQYSDCPPAVVAVYRYPGKTLHQAAGHTPPFPVSLFF